MYSYDENQPVAFDSSLGIYKEGTVTGSTRYSKNKVLKRFHGLEPRFAISYKANENNAFKANYNRTFQYIHLISNTVAATPIDVWQPSTNNIKPQTGNQIAVGYFKNLQGNLFETSAEVYYKWNKRDTNTKGRFIGEFHIHNSMGKLIAPIRENLYINII